ncbi:hypothetical protein PCYB_141020 [Plasmodium cynomolgi strain B]|uniref:Pv-fam-d protein n=1 Tax=Plasmodium cynomolgi (strain B) TaxID=1120755 RepID=K6V0U2_PLACD|nr:hypothetical protein PCYB_141020 [Plasmodium cynomolgi strain B]GAB68675.1 hypothetical protein PCYB_141020 [Plasmodium cynomolgi strain B]
MNTYEYDDTVKLHNTFNFNDKNKNLNKDINLIEFEDFGKVEYFQKLNNKPAKETNPFTVPNNFTTQNSSQNLYSESAKQFNTFAPTNDFGKLHNSINVNKQPSNKPTAITPTSDFEKLHNSINVNRQPVKKPNIIRADDGFGKQQNSQNVNEQATKETNSIDPTEDFAKLHNSLNFFNKPKEKISNVYRDNDNFEKRYSTLKDDFYSEKLFNSAYEADYYQSKDKTHEVQYFYDEPKKHQNYKNDFSDLKKNGRPNAHFDKMYNDLLKGNNFESEKRVLKQVDDHPKKGSGKPLIDLSEDVPKNSSEKNPNDIGKSPYTKNRSNALSYAKNIEKILNKLKYFNNVETAVDELKNDPSFKKILDELQNGNGLERLFYVLKYSDDSEGILSELKKNDNIEKLIYVLNYYEKNSEPQKKEELKKVASKKDHNGNNKLSLLNVKKKKLKVWITKLFDKFDQMYEDQLLSLFSSEFDNDGNDSTDNKKFLHTLKYVKILIPIAFAVIIIAILSVSAVAYTIFKVKKCHYKKKVERINKKNAKKASKPSIIKVSAS